MEHELPEQVTKDLQIIQHESARACNIIRNLALFARQQPGQAVPVRLNDVVTSVVELRQIRLATEQIDLVVDGRSLNAVMAVFAELQQVLLNCVVNAEHVLLSSLAKASRSSSVRFPSYDWPFFLSAWKNISVGRLIALCLSQSGLRPLGPSLQSTDPTSKPADFG